MGKSVPATGISEPAGTTKSATTLDGSGALARGDLVAQWALAVAGDPRAIVVTLNATQDAAPWMNLLASWRSSLDPASRQPAVILHVRDTGADQHGNLMLQAIDSGVDDVVTGPGGAGEITMRITRAVRFRDMTTQLCASNRELTRLCSTDDLTGLLNMRAFRPQLVSSLRRLDKTGHGLAVVMMDVDLFKQVNDGNNHLVGSDILRSVGGLIRTWCETADPGETRAARYGGDEFAFYFEAASPEIAFSRVDELRRLISGQVFLSHGRVVRVTASFGICWVAPGTGLELTGALGSADAMLYRSKALGRNQVSIVDSGVVSGNPVDLDHVRRPDLVDRNTGSDHDRLTRVDEAEVLQKVG